MQEFSSNSHTLTFPTLLICCSAAEGEGAREEEIYKGHLASAAVGAVVEQQPAHLIYHWDMGAGGGAAAPVVQSSHSVSFPRPRKWGRDF